MRRINKTRFVAGLIGGVLTSSPALAQTSPTQQCVANAYAGGTSDAITIPALPCALSTNLLILSTTLTNVTTTPTLQPLGLPAQTIIRSNGNPVQAGDLVAGGKALLIATGTQWVLLNPSNVTGGSGSINGAPAGYMAYYANTGSILSGSPLGAGVLTSLSYASDTPYGFVSYNGALGTPSSGTATNITGLPVTTGISGLGLGVAIALGLSPGAIGSFVVNGGALGVPTSGVATYLTGLPLTSGVTGTLGVANGGTGGTSFTANRPIVGNGSGALTTGSTSGTGFILATELAAIPAGHCVDTDGNGNLADAGGTCTTGGSSGVVASGSVGQIATYSGSTTVSGTTTGTNVVTALGVNVGTAGSFVVQGGVLGTPSSGVASNLTGIPMGNASGTLGVSNGGTGAGTFSSGKPILGNGTGAFTSASISGNTTTLATTNGSLTSGDCAKFDASGNIVDSGGGCGSPLSANNTWTGTNTFNNSVSFVLNPTFPVQSPNVVFAGPTSGGSTTPTWRSLVTADLPTVAVTQGGTGQTTFTANSPLIGNGAGAIAQGTRSGSTTNFGTVNGALTNGHCVSIDASGNLIDAGSACSGSKGSVVVNAISDCPNGGGTCTDNLTAFSTAITAAVTAGANLVIPCGSYFISAGLVMSNTTDTAFTNPRPSILGGGARCTFLYFGNGNFNGLTFAGTNAQNPSALSMQNISGLSLFKSDYQGFGLVLENFDHIHGQDLYAQGWNLGMYFQDVQESVFVNLFSEFNLGGLVAVKSTFTPPNAISCYGCSFSANVNYGADFQNPSVVNINGGAIEENGYGGGSAWGLRFIYPYNTDVESNLAGNISGMYFERNSGAADILFANGQTAPTIPSGLTLTGNNFNRGYNAIGATVATSIASPCVVTFANHGFVVGQPVEFTTTGALPTGIVANTQYYVIAAGLGTNSFEISATAGGAAINTSGSQSGVQTVYSHAVNVVQALMSNSNPFVLTMTGNGFGGLPRTGSSLPYVPSATTPYIGVPDVTQPTKVCSNGNRYNDYQETGYLFNSCDFADIEMDEAPTTVVRKENNIASYTRNGTGDYTLTFAFPGTPTALNTVAYATTYSSSTAGYATITSYSATTMEIKYFNMSGAATDPTNISIRITD